MNMPQPKFKRITILMPAEEAKDKIILEDGETTLYLGDFYEQEFGDNTIEFHEKKLRFKVLSIYDDKS